MKYLHFDDASGAPLGFYSQSVHGENIPTPNIQVDDATWRDVLINPKSRRVNLDTLEVEVFTPPPEVVPIPEKISFRQAVIGAVTDEWITEAEGDAWAQRNDIPQIVKDYIASLREEAQFAARATAYTMTEVYRMSAMMIAVASLAMPGKTDQEVSDALDTFFQTYSQA